MGVAGELAMAIQAAEVEAEQDLPDPVAVLLGVGLEVLEAGPLDVLADQHAFAGERRHHGEARR